MKIKIKKSLRAPCVTCCGRTPTTGAAGAFPRAGLATRLAKTSRRRSTTPTDSRSSRARINSSWRATIGQLKQYEKEKKIGQSSFLFWFFFIYTIQHLLMYVIQYVRLQCPKLFSGQGKMIQNVSKNCVDWLWGQLGDYKINPADYWVNLAIFGCPLCLNFSGLISSFAIELPSLSNWS